MQSAYVDRDNKRFGVVRDLISPQDEINKRRSKALHLLSTRLVITETGAVEDEDKARREVAKPDGFITVTPGMRFEIAQTADLAAGQMKLLEHATQEMQASGPNASMSGTDDKELSGRAILANQAGGAAQNEPTADSLRYWSRNVYEMIWMGARQYWNAEKWVRVTDDLGTIKWVGINRPVTLADELAAMPEAQRSQAMQRLQIQPNDPRLQQVIRVENDISDLDVDITVAEGQNIPTLEAENFQTLVQLASLQPGLIPGEVLIAASNLRNKDQLLDLMKQHQQAQAQTQQQAAQLATQHAQATINDMNSKAAANMALAKERTHNTMQGLHEMHQDFTAPPYGLSWTAADNAPQGQAPQQPQGDGVDPAVANAQAIANVQHTAAQTNTERLKAASEAARARDLHMASVKKAAETHAIMHPPPPVPPRAKT